MASPETQAYWSQHSGYLPIRASALEVPAYRAYLDRNPGLKAFAEQMSVARASRAIDYFSLEIQQQLAMAIERATVGRRRRERRARAGGGVVERDARARRPHAAHARPCGTRRRAGAGLGRPGPLTHA